MAFPCVRAYPTPLDSCDWSTVRGLYDDMRHEARASFAGEVVAEGTARHHLAADMRYAGQYHELRVALPEGVDGPRALTKIAAAFRARYEEVYGRALPHLPIEVLNWHLTAELPRPALASAPESGPAVGIVGARGRTRSVYFQRPTPGFRECRVYDRYHLSPGATFAGPCIIEEREATIVVPPGSDVTVDPHRNVLITVP